MRAIVLVPLLLVLPGCVAAIGNTGYGLHAYPAAAAPLLQERVAAATRIVELRERQLAAVRQLVPAGRVGADDMIALEVQLEEAKLRLCECRIDLNAAQAKKDD